MLLRAVALARSLFRKGANFTAAMAFEIASTNLVIELGIILALLMGWQFTAAEFVGGPMMIIVLAVLFRLFLRRRLLDAAREQADKGLAGSMEGHAAMDMSRARGRRRSASAVLPAGLHRGQPHLRHGVGGGPARHRDRAADRRRGRRLGAGRVLADVLPRRPPDAGQDLGPDRRPGRGDRVSFVCSIGNVPLAAVLWNGGISFGGVVASSSPTCMILPILVIYRKYYGTRMALSCSAPSTSRWSLAGYVVEILFGAARPRSPTDRNATVIEAGITWNYTTWLNIAFLVLAAVLVVRFVRTGGLPMLRMMGGGPDDTAGHDHDTAHDGQSVTVTTSTTRTHQGVNRVRSLRRTNTAPERKEVPPSRARRLWARAYHRSEGGSRSQAENRGDRR